MSNNIIEYIYIYIELLMRSNTLPDNVCLIVILLYDWLAYFSDEVHAIWNCGRTGTGMLFLANRYVVLSQYACLAILDWTVWSNGSVSTFVPQRNDM